MTHHPTLHELVARLRTLRPELDAYHSVNRIWILRGGGELRMALTRKQAMEMVEKMEEGLH